MKGRPVADGVAWPIPSISGAHAHYAHYACNSTAHAYTCIAFMMLKVQRQLVALYGHPTIITQLEKKFYCAP